jgi:hypothetical protein
MFGQS